MDPEQNNPGVPQNNQNIAQNQEPNYMIPGAIVLAGVIIAGAIYYSNNAPRAEITKDTGAEKSQSSPDNVKPVTSGDHILGDPNAPVKIIEFSDFECPYCKVFHGTMKQVMDEYGKDGRAAWVYRHFPLDSIHPKARKEAEASECAAELGGNQAFWKYADRIFEITPSNNGLDPKELSNVAQTIGLDVLKFNECLASGKYANRIQEQLDDALASGARGTPYSVVLAQDGSTSVIGGALPYAQVKTIIETVLKK